VDRTRGESGVCETADLARVSSAFPHFGEERVLVGAGGSGTVFFSQCNLHCVFCQNRDISHFGEGREVTTEGLADLVIGLQSAGCENINFVTPSHVTHQVALALEKARGLGLEVPVVFNTSAYDKVETLECLEGLVDIYMPDFKFWSPVLSERYMGAGDYPEVARKAIIEMHRQVGDLSMDHRGVAVRGLLVRHLVMPRLLTDCAKVMEFVASVSKDSFVNVMGQYRPVGRADDFPEISTRPSSADMAGAREVALDAGIHRLVG